MDDDTTPYADEVSTQIVRDGHTLWIHSQEVEPGQWELIIENALGVHSVWFELYPSAQAALAAGLAAIDEEGVAAFTDVEGFEYLLEGRRH